MTKLEEGTGPADQMQVQPNKEFELTERKEAIENFTLFFYAQVDRFGYQGEQREAALQTLESLIDLMDAQLQGNGDSFAEFERLAGELSEGSDKNSFDSGLRKASVLVNSAANQKNIADRRTERALSRGPQLTEQIVLEFEEVVTNEANNVLILLENFNRAPWPGHIDSLSWDQILLLEAIYAVTIIYSDYYFPLPITANDNEPSIKQLLGKNAGDSLNEAELMQIESVNFFALQYLSQYRPMAYEDERPAVAQGEAATRIKIERKKRIKLGRLRIKTWPKIRIQSPRKIKWREAGGAPIKLRDKNKPAQITWSSITQAMPNRVRVRIHQLLERNTEEPITASELNEEGKKYLTITDQILNRKITTIDGGDHWYQIEEAERASLIKVVKKLNEEFYRGGAKEDVFIFLNEVNNNPLSALVHHPTRVINGVTVDIISIGTINKVRRLIAAAYSN